MYKADSYKEPFWAENQGFMTGRDPLGVQNSSIATYSRLLPGMTNVTLRLRYYGFHMWLLQMYDEMEKTREEQSLTFHYNFIRRAELAIAYLMANKFPDEVSIVGSDYANNHLHTIEELGYYDLASGADKVKDTEKYSVYWDYRSGALGQYFAGSFISLNLIEMNHRFFVLMEKGRRLAKAFAEGISEESKRTMIDAIRSGRMSRAQMDALADFSVSGIREGSPEWQFYKDMILADDGIYSSQGHLQYQRRETIKYYLEYLDHAGRSEEQRSFDRAQYQLNTESLSDDASFGWFYYRVNEMLHYSLETIFWGLLMELDGQVFDIHEFMEVMTAACLHHSLQDFLRDEKITIQEVLIEGLPTDLEEWQAHLEGLVRSKSHKKAMALALKQMLAIYTENQPRMDAIKKYEQKNYLTDKKGRVSEVADTYILRNKELSYRDFIYACIKGLINDHISTAYRKMGSGESNLLKFVIEDNFITHVQTMTPRFTSPRLRTLDNFLTDLHFKDDTQLSDAGTELLLELTT